MKELPFQKDQHITYPLSLASPEHLQTVGALFELKQVDLSTARVLELGCANGTNLLNFALNNPNAKCVGIDISKELLDEGNQIVKALEIKNLDLKLISVTELDHSIGEFDYIICHGMASWVSTFVRDKIFEVAKKLLAPNGIAYISYNTRPGWNMASTIRDMMQFHSSLFESSDDKLKQAKLFLNLVTQSLGEQETPYANFLRDEISLLTKFDDQHLKHEYLAENNQQFYFHKFIEKANANGLAYLADAQYHTMFVGNMPSKIAEKLIKIPSIVRTEQYMDFINNRRFRSSLLCHDNTTINRNITRARVENFYIASDLVADEATPSVELLNNSIESCSFKRPGSELTEISTTSPVIKAILYTLTENAGNPLRMDELIDISYNKYNKIPKEEFENEFNQVLGRFVFSPFIKLFAKKPASIAIITDRPQISKLAIYQAQNLNPKRLWITNQLNETFVIYFHEKYVLALLNGLYTIYEIKEMIFEKFKSKEIIVNENDTSISELATLRIVADKCVDLALERMRINYVLIG